MKRTLTVGTIIVLFIMIAATLSSSNLGFTLMMSTGLEHNIARIVLIGALLAVALTSRPRGRYFRMSLATISATIAAYALIQTSNYGLQLFDALAYMLAGLILMTESLEVEPQRMELSSSKKLAE